MNLPQWTRKYAFGLTDDDDDDNDDNDNDDDDDDSGEAL